MKSFGRSLIQNCFRHSSSRAVARRLPAVTAPARAAPFALAPAASGSKGHPPVGPHPFCATQSCLDGFFIEDRRIDIRKVLKLQPGDLLADEMLDFFDMRKLLRGHDGE